VVICVLQVSGVLLLFAKLFSAFCNKAHSVYLWLYIQFDTTVPRLNGMFLYFWHLLHLYSVNCTQTSTHLERTGELILSGSSQVTCLPILFSDGHFFGISDVIWSHSDFRWRDYSQYTKAFATCVQSESPFEIFFWVY